MELTFEQISLLVNVVFVILALVFAKDYRRYKSLVKEVGEALVATYDAMLDKKITPEEAEKLAAEYEDVYYEIKNLRL